MKTLILPATEVNITLAAQIIRDGGLVAFPTETVYGLGANALNPDAVRKIFTAKGRPADNPLICHIADLDALSDVAQDVPQAAFQLAEKHCPGPLSLVLSRRSAVPDEVSAGLNTVAVRLPNHPVALALIRASGCPIAAPSANASGKPSPTTAQHVLEDLDGKVDIILDGGPCGVGVESTVVSLCGPIPRLLRPGGITAEQLRETLPDLELDAALFEAVGAQERVCSPGMKYKHYAPNAPVTVVCGDPIDTARYIFLRLYDGKRVGIICFSEFSQMFPADSTIAIGEYDDPASQAQKIFDALRKTDTLKVDIIYAQCPSEEGIGFAVANRLKKAAGFSIINV